MGETKPPQDTTGDAEDRARDATKVVLDELRHAARRFAWRWVKAMLLAIAVLAIAFLGVGLLCLLGA